MSQGRFDLGPDNGDEPESPARRGCLALLVVLLVFYGVLAAGTWVALGLLGWR